ncbi:putative HTLV-1-related endogenous sequence [Balaenoptera acutorostrata]|uniref:HTLV-1-related endogenous sequence n=1 Tax=Balaenoptera acutorostrata TaxID=9767 RepID=A0A452CG47_BALAC|nr:putative HTLV-1-related endogenous sequence [Balaenoptera acutorostrata]
MLGPPLRHFWPAAPPVSRGRLASSQRSTVPRLQALIARLRPRGSDLNAPGSPRPRPIATYAPPTSAAYASALLPQLLWRHFRRKGRARPRGWRESRVAVRQFPGLRLLGLGAPLGAAVVCRAGARPQPPSRGPCGPPLAAWRPPGSTEVSEARSKDPAPSPRPAGGIAMLPLAFRALVSGPCNRPLDRRIGLRRRRGSNCGWTESRAFPWDLGS